MKAKNLLLTMVIASVAVTKISAQNVDYNVSSGGEDQSMIQKKSVRLLSDRQNAPNPAKKTYFYDSFVNGVQGNWTVIDGNKDGETWFFVSNTVLQADFGAAVILGVTGTASDWLITPQINIPGGVGNLEMNFAVIWYSKEVLDVKISTTTKDTTAFSSVGGSPITLTGDGGNAAEYYVTLAKSSSNRNIYFAFVNRSKGGNLMLITDVYVQGDYPTGIEDIKQADAPIIYTQGKSLYIKNIFEKSTAEIYDMSGRLQDRVMVSSDMCKVINTPGIYIVKLKNNKQTDTYKVIIR